MGGYTMSVTVLNGKPALKTIPLKLNFEVIVRPQIKIDGKNYLKAWPRTVLPEGKYCFGYCLID